MSKIIITPELLKEGIVLTSKFVTPLNNKVFLLGVSAPTITASGFVLTNDVIRTNQALINKELGLLVLQDFTFQGKEVKAGQFVYVEHSDFAIVREFKSSKNWITVPEKNLKDNYKINYNISYVFICTDAHNILAIINPETVQL